MRRLLPQSLIGQMLLILIAGLLVSHAIGWWIYASDREAAVREVGGLASAQRIVNLVRLIESAPPDWRERIVAASSDRSFRLSLSADKPDLVADEEPGPVATAIRAYLIDQLALGAKAQPVIATAEAADPPFGRGRGRGWGRHMSMMGGGPGNGFGARMGMMDEPATLIALDAAVPLSNGQWLMAATALPAASPIYSRSFLASMLAMAGVIVGASIWATRRVTAPLAALAAAAQRLGRDVDAPPISETGTVETRQASRAFNEMQAKLRAMIDNRTRLLAAISHDLRTPLTLLRLRAENVADVDERDKMLATLAEMDAMVGETLRYARDETTSEPVRTTDLTALVASVVDDMADACMPATLTAAEPILLACRAAALKRAIRNLADNAVKYGAAARVQLQDGPQAVDIVVDDDGPGVPAAELARVFEPFYRLETSRSRDTGGVGLGLAITRSLIERHGGTVILANRPGGGLRARISLPK